MEIDGAAGSALPAIQVSFQHLGTSCSTAAPRDTTTTTTSSSSPTVHRRLALTAARYVHRTSHGCKALARSTIRHLDVSQYPGSSAFSNSDAADNSSEVTVTLPWDILGAAAGLRSLKLITSHIPALLTTPSSCFPGLAARLTRLEVTADERGAEEEEGQPPRGAWQLPDLLAACTGLKQLQLWYHEVEPCLAPGTAGTLPALPLTSLKLGGSAVKWALPWVVGRLAPTLRVLHIWSTVGRRDDPVNTTVDLSCLGALKGLRELTLEEVHRPGASSPGCDRSFRTPPPSDPEAAGPLQVPETLKGLPHLTKLVLRDGQQEWSGWRRYQPPSVVWELTQLRHLELAGYADLTTMQFRQAPVSSYCRDLTGLTQLDLSRAFIQDVTLDLGTTKPHLEVLHLPLEERQRLLPTCSTRLTELTIYSRWPRHLARELWDLTGLRKLHLAVAGGPAEVSGVLHNLIALEELQIEHRPGTYLTRSRGRLWPDTDWHRLILAGLTALRKLVLIGAHTLDAGAAAATAGSDTSSMEKDGGSGSQGGGNGSGAAQGTPAAAAVTSGQAVAAEAAAATSTEALAAAAAAAVAGMRPFSAAAAAAAAGAAGEVPAATAGGEVPAGTCEAPGAEGSTAAACLALGAETSPLFGLGALPHLEILHLPHHVFDSPHHMSAWLAQQTTLTQLVFTRSGRVPPAAALKLLPVQLAELSLPGGLNEVPSSFTRLQQLTQLCMGLQPAVTQLPEWLSALQRLEGLDVSGTRVTTPQPVLGQLPLLRRLWLPNGVDEEAVCAHAPYLC